MEMEKKRKSLEMKRLELYIEERELVMLEHDSKIKKMRQDVEDAKQRLMEMQSKMDH